MSKDQKPTSDRRARLAEALRANLRRRKEAMRARSANDQEAESDSADSMAEVSSGDSGETRVPK